MSDEVTTKVQRLLKDLVTQERAVTSLSDEELCDSLTTLDLPSTFYEHEKRGLDCLGIRIPQKGWDLPTRKQAFKHLKNCLLYTSPSPRDQRGSRMPSSA